MGIHSKPGAALLLLDAARIRAATFVQHVEIHDALGSTNDRAAELARQTGVRLPALIVARRQTSGRGRRGSSWWSGDGALTFSVLLEPATLQIPSAQWPRLSLAVAVAVCDAIQSQRVPRPGIKWPNDVMLQGRKICGILLESPGGPASAGDRLIVGIGINVNNSMQDAPAEAARFGTSLFDVTGQRHELEPLLVGLLQELETRLSELGRNKPQLPLAWQGRCVLTGKTIHIESGSEHIEGFCRGISADGAIVVETAAGRRTIYSGHVVAATSLE